ncbi:unnamed protein product [Diamesa serratosioi]
MIWVIYFVAVCVFYVSWYYYKFNERDLHLSKIPQPPSWPLIGNSFEFINKSPAEIFETLKKFSSALGNVWRFSFHPFEHQIMISDPKLVEALLSSHKQLEKTDDYRFVRAWLGDGLLLSDGKKWFKRRKIITPTFHFKILEQFVDVMNSQGQIFVSNLGKFNGQNPVDIFPLVTLYALDVICICSMGTNVNAQIDSNSTYVKTVKEIAELIFLRSFDFKKRNDFLYSFTEMYRREMAALKILHDFTKSVIVARREQLNKEVEQSSPFEEEEDGVGSKKKVALLDLLLRSTIDGESLSDNDIQEEVDTFMFEGHDTTTSAISFAFYNIAKYPEIQQKIYEESRSVLGDDLMKPVTLSQFNELHYLELFIKENLRLYPSVPFYGRKLSDDVKVGDITMPKDSNVVIGMFMMGRDPNIFPDPLVFNPDRFAVETSYEKNNPFSYVPFSAGPRNCIGQKFAMLEMKSIISKVVRNFLLTITKEDEDLKLISELVLRSENGVRISVKKRE